MKKEDLKNIIDECMEKNLACCLAITIPDRRTANMLIIHPENLEYCYDEFDCQFSVDLVNINNEKIKIVEAYPVNFQMNEEE